MRSTQIFLNPEVKPSSSKRKRRKFHLSSYLCDSKVSDQKDFYMTTSMALGLPSDMIFEILSCTSSLKTLDACKTVSKEWKDLIYDPGFMPVYCKKTNNLSGFFIQSTLSMFVSLDGMHGSGSCMGMLPKGMKILATCNQGLVLSRDDEYRYFVGKPSVGKWESIPSCDPHHETSAVGLLVLGSKPLRYKVVRLWHGRHSRYNKFTCEIFDSKMWKWRRTKGIILPYLELIRDTIPAVSAGNSIYWVTTNNMVIVFNGKDGSFDKFPLPDLGIDGVYEYERILEFNGRLGLVGLAKDGRLELWEMKGSSIHYEWYKKMEVNIGTLQAEYRFTCVGFYNNEIIYMKAFDEIVFYNINSCKFSKVKLDFGLRCANEIFQLRSDMESDDLKMVEFQESLPANRDIK